MSGRQVPVSRRSAIRSGALAALAAGLLGTTRADASAPAPLVVAPVSNVADIAAEVEWRVRLVREKDRAAQAAQHALAETLTPEQRRLLGAYEEADNDRDFEQIDLYLVELGRHLPGLHPAIWALSRHIFESRWGECCAACPEDES